MHQSDISKMLPPSTSNLVSFMFSKSRYFIGLISFSSIKQVTPLASFSSYDFCVPVAEREHVWFRHMLRWYYFGCVGITLVMLALDIWLHILVILYFTSTLVSRCNYLPKKVPKRIVQKKRQQQIRDEDVSFILSFIYWVQQPFRGWGSFSWRHWNGWIPQ